VISRARVNPAWWELIRIRARSLYAYRSQVFITCPVFMLQLYALRSVWEAIYKDRDSVDGISSQLLLTYLTVAALHRFFLQSEIAYNIQTRVTSGTVANDLIRPFGFMKQMMALQVGAFLGFMPLLVVFVPAALLVGSLHLPSPGNFLLYLLSLVLAFVVTMLIWIHVGLLTFWMIHVNGIRAMLTVASDFLAGALVPLWFMPDTLRVTLEWLPFQATTYLPATVFAEQVSGLDAARQLLLQGCWIAVLIVTVNLVWRRAQHKLVIQGG
jgi:ABC-type uncharacterized transport system permease subunit